MSLLPGKSFFAPKVAEPVAPPPVPQPEDPEVTAQKKKNEEAARGRIGIGQTIKTSGLGVTTDANTQRKTLLG